MARKRCLISAIVPLLACLFLGQGEVAAAGKREQLEQLRKQIKDVDADLQKLQREKARLTEQLKDWEVRYGRVVLSVKQLESEVEQSRKVLGEVENKISRTRKALAGQKNELRSLVKSAHAMGGNGRERLKVVFNQQDPALSSRMLVYYDYLNRERLKKLRAIEGNYRELQELERKSKQETERLTANLEKRRKDQNELQEVKREREKLVAQIDRLYSTKQTRLKQLQNDENKLSRLIASLQKKRSIYSFKRGAGKAYAQSPGQLPWPVQGTLEKRFGSPRSESRWDGVLINASEGTPIHAVTRGRVVYADWLRGYGLLTIIDHGKGFMTLYAFNQSLYKAEGEWVDAGDVIAAVGKSGGRSQAALYFGIRIKGKPVDPLRWCRKIHNGKVG